MEFLIFIGWFTTFLLCCWFANKGFLIAEKEWGQLQEVKVKGSQSETSEGRKKVNITLKLTTGTLLALAGLGGCIYILIKYWQMLIVLIVLGLGGHAANRIKDKLQ